MDETFLELTEEEQEAFAKMSGKSELPAGVRDCWSAIKAAASAVGDYCGTVGMTMPVSVGGVSLSAPSEIMDIANSDLPREERITAIANTDWYRETIPTMCERLFGTTPGTPEHEKCVKTASRRLAEEAVRGVER